jgi:hypothetical protein
MPRAEAARGSALCNVVSRGIGGGSGEGSFRGFCISEIVCTMEKRKLDVSVTVYRISAVSFGKYISYMTRELASTLHSTSKCLPREVKL